MIFYFILAGVILILPEIISHYIKMSPNVYYFVVKVRNFLAIPNTIIHELSHIFAAFLTGGRGYSIKINSDLSGTAVTSSPSRFSEIVIGLSGYIGASFISYFLTVLFVEDNHTVLNGVLLAMFVLTVLLIRNLYGVVWLAIVGGVVYFLPSIPMGIVFVLIAICSVESWMSTWRVLVLAFKYPEEKSDATDLSRVTKIPAKIWGVLFFLIASYILILQIKLMF